MIKIAFLGCGFLATHLISPILPYASHIILIDRERIEKENYDNSIFPKNLSGVRKVSALAGYIQVLSSIPVTPIHKNIANSVQLIDIYDKTKFDFAFCTFDNIESRAIVREFATHTNTPVLCAGVSEDYIYIDWVEYMVLPDKDKIERVKLEMKHIRDVCTRLEFRVLGTITAGYSLFSFLKYINNKEKQAFIISVRDKINATTLTR